MFLGASIGGRAVPLSFLRYVFVRPTVIVGLFLQQVIALFVLKTGAGFSLFHWIATLAGDFLNQALPAAAFFFDADTIGKHWFFVNTVRGLLEHILSIVLITLLSLALLHYLLHCLHSDALLSWRHAVGHQALVSSHFVPGFACRALADMCSF